MPFVLRILLDKACDTRGKIIGIYGIQFVCNIGTWL